MNAVKNARLLDAVSRALTDADRWNKLRVIMGYVENGTDARIWLGQDDATRDWVLRVGYGTHSQTFHGTLDAVINEAYARYAEEES